MPAFIYVTTQFVAFHRWTEAPDEVSFLRQFHRHVFHVKVVLHVSHNDRDLEFFIIKARLENYIQSKLAGRFVDWSCETIATMILDHFQAAQVDVSEDGENGAVVTANPPSQ